VRLHLGGTGRGQRGSRLATSAVVSSGGGVLRILVEKEVWIWRLVLLGGRRDGPGSAGGAVPTVS
jgi:hypothetical protein